MARKKKKVPGLNASSTADISFILLIFFLVTTSMDTDTGLTRRLPQPPEPNQEDASMDVKERNVLNVKMNADGNIMIKSEIETRFFNLNIPNEKADGLRYLNRTVKEFVQNKDNNSRLPQLYPREVELIGMCNITEKHVVSVQTDRGTPYQVYFDVQDVIVGAYNELRDEAAKKYFSKPYDKLSEAEKVAIRTIYPQKISEAEPKTYGDQN
ncbi:MAG: biopolymer transporter ExbD [Bacteroidaceae bacterium]|nr:biopolymer transporter ExbD [Bacteroidaceae bacterium]